jgi:hypothetical protein
LQGEKNNDEQVELEKKIADLKKAKEEKKNQHIHSNDTSCLFHLVLHLQT